MENEMMLEVKTVESDKIFVTRKKMTVLLSLCCFLPLLALLFFASFQLIDSNIFIICGLMCGFSLYCTLYLVRQREAKMRLSLNALLQAKIQKLESMRLTEEGQERTEMYSLKTRFEEARRGYEHQIDLLQTSIEKSRVRVEEMTLELNQKNEEARALYLELDDLKKELYSKESETKLAHEELERQLKHKETLILDYQQTIGEQRLNIEKKQRYIAKLEGKVRDLMYEIRSLLQLEDSAATIPKQAEISQKQEPIYDYYLPTQSKSQPAFDLSQQLQRYLENAERITGVEHLGYREGKSLRFYDMLDSSAIDQRRFFDSLRDEATGILFVFSLLEYKFLFVNNYAKTALGYSPEKLMKDFSQIVTGGFLEWKQALSHLTSTKESQNKMRLQNKGGDQIIFDCRMRLITQGPFSNHVLGILSKKET